MPGFLRVNRCPGIIPAQYSLLTSAFPWLPLRRIWLIPAQFGPVCPQPSPCASRLGREPTKDSNLIFSLGQRCCPCPAGSRHWLCLCCQPRGQGLQEPRIAPCCNIPTPAPSHCPLPALLYQTLVPQNLGWACWGDAQSTPGHGHADLGPCVAQGQQRAGLHHIKPLFSETL